MIRRRSNERPGGASRPAGCGLCVPSWSQRLGRRRPRVVAAWAHSSAGAGTPLVLAPAERCRSAA